MTDAAVFPTDAAPVPAHSRARLWFPLALLLIYWPVAIGVTVFEFTNFTRAVARFGGGALVALLFLIWWLTRGRAPIGERLLCAGLTVLAACATFALKDHTLSTMALVLTGPPAVATVWLLALAAVWNAPAPVRFWATRAAALLTWLPFLCVRMEGLTGEIQTDLRWRWTPTAHELFLADLAKRPAPTGSEEKILVAKPNDWTGFRGAERDGIVHGIHIATDWNTSPPKQLWWQRAGPSWSSILVIDGRLFTQEQRAKMETVVCMDAATGKEIWVHADETLHYDGESGEGPRATPTFKEGRLVTLGATGVLNCLDAATGAVHWTHNIAADSGAAKPMWGFCSSPLIVNGLAIVFAGGKGDKNLLAYRLDSGALAWTAPCGPAGYASPQLVELDHVPQVVFFSERALTAVNPETGKVLWEYMQPRRGAQRTVQPHGLGGSSLLITSDVDFGTARLEVAHNGDTWKATTGWRSPALKPSYNDYVIRDGYIYGFDGGIFTCVDVSTGKQVWREGNYGHGQVLLLADQALLIVLTDAGEVVLLEAKPEKSTELGRFEALKAKTWNHPAIADGRLYIRNAEKIMCYELEKK